MITKTNLIKEIQAETGFSASTVSKVIDKSVDVVMRKVAEGETVNIKNFGTFFSRNRAERSGRNPQTGQPIIIEAHKVPQFRAGKAFRENVNK